MYTVYYVVSYMHTCAHRCASIGRSCCLGQKFFQEAAPPAGQASVREMTLSSVSSKRLRALSVSGLSDGTCCSGFQVAFMMLASRDSDCTQARGEEIPADSATVVHGQYRSLQNEQVSTFLLFSCSLGCPSLRPGMQSCPLFSRRTCSYFPKSYALSWNLGTRKSCPSSAKAEDDAVLRRLSGLHVEFSFLAAQL